jgi:hypothetical protein
VPRIWEHELTQKNERRLLARLRRVLVVDVTQVGAPHDWLCDQGRFQKLRGERATYYGRIN